MSDIQFMQRALELAKLGRGSVSPNPMVGCVVTHEGKIIGEGYHKKYGQPHAEVNAIRAVKDHALLPSSTVYVTLEPCAHHGKTPPCADLLVEKQVAKVVIACRDPFERVDGKGIEKLRQAGISVELGVLEEEAKQLNARFFTYHQKKRPYVILKWARTQDGFIAREDGDSKWVSNAKSRQLVHKWRTEEDAILVGKNTAIHDNPMLTSRDWHGKHPVRVLLDSSLEADMGQNIFNTEAQTLIFNSQLEKSERNLQWIKVSKSSPSKVLQKLHEARIQSIIVEGGAQVLNSFIREKCWDEARLFTSDVTFRKGIESPKIPGEVISQQRILNDQLTIYQNYHG